MPKIPWRRRLHQRKAARYRNTPRSVRRSNDHTPDASTYTDVHNESRDPPQNAAKSTVSQLLTDHGYCLSSSNNHESSGSRTNNEVCCSPSLDSNPSVSTNVSDSAKASLCSTSSQVVVDNFNSQSIQDCSTSSTGALEEQLSISAPPIGTVEDVTLSNYDLLLQVKQKLELFLYRRWLVIIDKECLHIVYYSIQDCLVVQKSIIVDLAGNVKVFVHNEPICIDPFVKNLDPPVPLEVQTINYSVDRIVSIVSGLKKMQVCSGVDIQKFQAAWASCPLGFHDRNPFKECRFVETFRSYLCSRLVDERKWRCIECKKMYGPLKRRANAISEEERHPQTSNKFLSEKHMLKKMEKQHNDLRNAKKKIYTLIERMEGLIKKESVQLDHSMADDLAEVLNNCSMSPAQSIFMQQQIKASQQKNSCGMRWHPTMIRFALSVHLTSPSAYELMRQTGMVKLPSSSTLFEYSNVEKVKEGIDETVITSVTDRISKFNEKHKKYHVLMADEMYISQNLVFQKSTGRVIGYTSLDNIDSEIKNFENLIDNPDHEREETVASKMLVYMIKGVCNGIKEVIACFSVGKHLSANQLFVWTWKVIGALERSGVAVVAYVSDGASVNRSFIKKHKPATSHESGVTFDTVNNCAKDRILYFIADVPHLLKTIRNCILNSRWDGKKSRRKMMKNRKRISWDFIIKLYEMKKGKNLRKSYKLNPMNVYPDSYARMKVKLAAQPLSSTVCKDLRSQKWNDASETELFIEKVNEWFDCLNGAHSSQGKRTNNPNLNPYTSENDPRFKTLTGFLSYLKEWEDEVKNPNQSMNETVDGNNTLNAAVPDCDESEIEDGAFNPEEDTPASRRLLSSQTLEGIRMTSLAFIPLVSFLLKEGVQFLNARIFCQDPLEQHFSKIRAGGGEATTTQILRHLSTGTVCCTLLGRWA